MFGVTCESYVEGVALPEDGRNERVIYASAVAQRQSTTFTLVL